VSIFGGYWDHVLDANKNKIRNLPEDDRIALLTELATRIHMEGSSAAIFTEIALPDLNALILSMEQKIKDNPNAGELSSWIATFKAMNIHESNP
jgi:hypothetical protein